jgi:hypothetical protein
MAKVRRGPDGADSWISPSRSEHQLLGAIPVSVVGEDARIEVPTPTVKRLRKEEAPSSRT